MVLKLRVVSCISCVAAHSTSNRMETCTMLEGVRPFGRTVSSVRRIVQSMLKVEYQSSFFLIMIIKLRVVSHMSCMATHSMTLKLKITNGRKFDVSTGNRISSANRSVIMLTKEEYSFVISSYIRFARLLSFWV